MKGGREDVDTPFWSCQGLVDQNDRGKALVSEKSHFLKETFFRGVPAFRTFQNEGHK